MSIIQIKCLSALAALVLTGGAAGAQDFTAGKTPAQLFSSDCSTCHHQPNGLGKKYDNGSLASFLREHYTTKPDSAGALAKYVMGFATLRAAPITAPSADDTAAARPAEDPKARRRTTSTLSGDGEKPVRRSQPNNPAPNAPSTDERPVAAVARAATEVAAPTAPRNATALPPRASEGEASPPAAKLNDYAHSGAAAASREAADPLARIRAYATSGAGPQEAAAEAPRPASGKSHRRGDSAAPPAADTVPPAAVPPVSTAPAAPAPAAASVSSGAMPMPLPPAETGDKPGAPASVSSR